MNFVGDNENLEAKGCSEIEVGGWTATPNAGLFVEDKKQLFSV